MMAADAVLDEDFRHLIELRTFDRCRRRGNGGDNARDAHWRQKKLVHPTNPAFPRSATRLALLLPLQSTILGVYRKANL